MSCCQPTNPPSAAAYRRHIRARTVPCEQALKDSAAYRAARKPLKQRSTKTSSAYVDRRALVAAFLEERPVCQRCQAARSVDVHELTRRSQGGSTSDESNLRALCRPCHRHITEHPAAAVADGWGRWGMRSNPEDAA
jgi:5-methylcytosine-specific restriction endonuclease McrA